MVFSIFLATIPLLIAGINTVHDYQEYLKESVIDLQKEKAGRVAIEATGFLEKAVNTLLHIATTDAHVLKEDRSHTRVHLTHFLSQLDYLFELTLLDEKGFEKVKVSKLKAEETSKSKDQSLSPLFQAASRGQIYYGNFHYISDGKPSMAIAVPIEEYKGRPVGVLKGRIYLEAFTDLLHRARIGEQGSTYVVDQEGFLIAHPNDKNILLGPFVDWVIAGKEGSLEFEDLRGQKYLVAHKPIHKLKWGVIVQVPLEEALKPLREISQTGIKWSIIASIMAFILSLFLTRRLTSPIKQLSVEMDRVSQGNLDVQIEPSTKDEVGELTQSFNKMVKDLKRSREANEESEKKYRMIFENSKDMVFITSLDGEFIEINQAGAEMLGYNHKEELKAISVKDTYYNPEERRRFQEEVAQKGFAKDFEVKLKRKDGTQFDALITSTARKDGEGKIIGYEGTVKDISERKRMEETLLQRTKELETLYDLGILINQSLNLEQVIPLALEKVLSLTGFMMGTIYLLSDDGEWLDLRYHYNYPSHLAEVVKRLRKGEGVAGAAAEKKEVVIYSIDQYPSSRILPSLIQEKVRMLVGIPLLSKGEAIGALCLTSQMDHVLEGEEIRLYKSIGNQIGMAIENAKLYSSVEKAKVEWETTFNTVTDLITIRDTDYRIIQANRAAFVRWGMGPDQMIGKRCYEILHHQSVPCKECYVTEALKTKRPTSGERESGYLSGIFQFYTYPVYDDSGRVVAVVDLAREITEEKQKEKEKEVINNVFKILASSLDVRDVFKAVHSELNRVFATERMTVTLFEEDGRGFQFFGLDKDYEMEELKEGVIYPLEGTPSGKVAETGLPVIISNTEESEYWTSQKLAKEGIRSILVYPLEYKGEIFGTLNFGSMIVDYFSERHLNLLQQIAPGLAISIQNGLLLDEIKGSEEKYRTVVEGAMEGVLIVGDDFRFKYVNQRIADILGYRREELIGMDFREVLDETSQALVTERYLRRRNEEEVPPRYEFNVIRKDKEIRNVEISSNIVKDSKGNIHTIAFIKDVTETKKMEEQLLQSEKLRALGEMASGVAHDFNNALAAILGNTQLLLYTAQDEETRESLKTIEKVAKDSAQTVKRLQEFTRRRIEQELFEIDLNAILKDVVEITRPKWKDEAQKKGIQIEVLFQPGDVPSVSGNASEMREVFTNIIFNAIEAMPEGGKIEIRTYEKNGQAHVRIADTGIGMTEGVRKKIFEPFFTTKPFTNTGLGLSMSYGIIKRFGGEIEVESQVGSGTSFTIVLPASRVGKEETQSDVPIRESGSAHILVIDDEETVRDVLSKMLSKCNHQVTVAKSGEEGIQLFGAKNFDMVLTDLGMPGMSGWEVCRSIKRLSPSVPVGMITGWGLEIDEGMRRESGLDFIITKPFNMAQVIEVVSETMRQRTSKAS